MARKLTADDLSSAIYELEENSRYATMRELIEEFIDSIHHAETDPDEHAGLRAAAQFIDANWGLDHLDKYETKKYRS